MAQSDIQPTCSSSSACSTSSSTSSSPSSSSCKSVQFSRFIKISFTYPGDEYDRSALEPAKLTTADVSELQQMRSHWRQESREREDALHSGDDSDASLDDPCSPSCSCSQQHAFHRIHTHSLLQCATGHCSHSSPPCSPVLSHHDSDSCCSSEDEYDPAHSPQHLMSTLSPQQQQQYQRLKRFSGSRAELKGMMHRHNHLDQSKENVQCIA
ncbi:MAG: hypothetical protein J3Q66DRAFT_402849 [Benniella sp.]|nr:MAG: hypothetical protein J3Q66DRAFT_402849 [Benniella sp.]